ncbi:MAG: hypothetical protein M1331_00765 [Candidatus Marsarchaeota archaeon]|nr:hypothetical protein [Candidatus Marsarchaeota archaeon]MCL5105916.1 hypothetical protein [Candidatus Marsarchaeota archaeon]
MHSNIKFIHCAIPDLDFNDISILQRITVKAGNNQNQIAVRCLPFALHVFFNPESNNKEKLLKLKKTTGIRLFVSSKNTKSLFILHKNNIIRRKLNAVDTVQAGDGLDAAKAIRLGKIPVISDKERVGLIEKQLKIVMFLTNSKHIAQLSKAAVVRI